ncbi:hypothetical protein B0A48_14194 [Cryoendolithus antarcticus]|uniref:coproporphyrinogen oxidase n=1 Tax=Cryoendolithus antarcticus TaxID=1507870 RepID=A0A1V8SLN2_9PEZI|nr:hypothetical protein B0A48_14194 [Cryoendolithus antarcticus]
MSSIRPVALEAAVRQCTRSRPSPAFRNALHRRQAPKPHTQRRCYADGPGRPPVPSGLPERATVFAPKTRIAVGVVFISALIYSMVTGDKQSLSADIPTIAEQDTLRKRESGITATSPMRLRMEALIKAKQREIVQALEAIDGGKFLTDTWTRPNGGGGISCVLQEGKVFEKAGVNISIVYGTLPRKAISQMRVNHKALDPDVESLEFFAAGLSLVLHPNNPMAPTVHLNYRYFETANADGSTNAWWFGGGTDLTQAISSTKTNGGIFFDDLDESEKDQESLFAFSSTCLDAFLPSYLPIIKRRKDMPFGEQEKQWQQLRRGRYVEFNLVHDRGTAFGLATPGARIESVLMSLPLTARWQYMHEPEIGGREERLVQVLKQPVEWVE